MQYERGDPIEYKSSTNWCPATFHKYTGRDDSCLIRLPMGALAYATVSLLRSASKLDKDNPNRAFKKIV